MTVAILITIVILVCIIIALMAYNISIHKKITKFSNISEKINGLNVLQNFMDTIGEYSSVEEKIEKINEIILNKYNILYETQKRLEGIKKAPFDFYLPDYSLLIEF